ncbi:mitochondrial ornithine carrier protein [Savitreella phatthalungensis]
MDGSMTGADGVVAIDGPSGSQKVRSPLWTGGLEICFGSISGMVGKVIEYPFDTVKVRLQSQPSGERRYEGAVDCFRQSVRGRDGWWGLYRGLSAPLVGAMAENAMLFFAFARASELVRSARGLTTAGEDDTLTIMAAGAISGAATSFILTPIELVKCKIQVHPAFADPVSLNTVATTTSRGSHGTVAGVIQEVWKTHGVAGFWRGQVGTLIRESGGSLCWFTVYEETLRACRPVGTSKREGNTSGQMMMAGAVAGVAYNTLFFPADSVKSRMQTGVSTHGVGFLGTVRTMARETGFRGFFRGWGVTVVRAAPSNAAIFWVYEALCGAFM